MSFFTLKIALRAPGYATWHVGQGQLLCPYLGPTRTEADLAAHIEQVIDTDPDACWCFIVDQLNTHKSETWSVWWPNERIWTWL